MNLNNYFVILCVVLSFVSTIAISQNRMIGGSDSDIRNSPYVVSVHIDGNYRCVGSLITRKKVLTAHSCLEGYDASRITVRAGATDYHDRTHVRTADHIIRPSDIHLSMVGMDLAMIVLETRFSDGATRKPIKLCDPELNPGVKLRVFGWGVKNAQIQEYCPILQSAEFELVPRDECENSYRDLYAAAGKNFPSTLICLTDRSLASDVSTGDAGAPAVYNGKLCAVVSAAVQCLNPNYPTLYTSVTNDNVRDFIESAREYR